MDKKKLFFVREWTKMGRESEDKYKSRLEKKSYEINEENNLFLVYYF